MRFFFRLKEWDHLRGDFHIKVYWRGRLIEDYAEHNLIVNSARLAMTKLIAGAGTGKNISRIAFGSNGSIPVVGDTAITSPYLKNISSISYPANNKVEFAWSLGVDEANGKAISEFGLLCADGSLFARKSRTAPLNKDSDIAIEGQWIIIF
ncbi:MAG: hypothetical protein LBS57_06510 [Treponema sp.]|jgi:hypothetical protein|nr:hypothetical protein [Treponema sp.]